MRFLIMIDAAALALLLAATGPAARAQAAPPRGGDLIQGTSIDASPAPAAAPAAATNSPVFVGGYRVVDFELLAGYPFNAPNDKLTNQADIAAVEKQVPAGIKDLDGKKVLVSGFLQPVKDVQGRSTEFLLVRNQPNCCYSGMTTITEFVSVKVPVPGVEEIMDQPVTVQGTLHVGAILESGYVLRLSHGRRRTDRSPKN